MKRNIAILFAALGLLTLLSVCAAFLLRPTVATLIRNRFERSLSEQFQSRVTFSDFHFSFSPFPRASVTGITLSYRHRTDIPPLIQVSELSMAVPWRELFASQLRIRNVKLKGLEITLPPRQNANHPPRQRQTSDLAAKYPVFIERIETQDATITLLRAQPEKRPLVYQLHRLVLKNVNFSEPAEFDAWLSNAVPRGEIHAQGTFGPWDSDTPRATPVEADYEFRHADLSTINGLEGMLSSVGRFGGPLDYLDVQGTTVIPDFTLRRVANPVALTTKFSATVDGTNGNTYLHSVEAHFLHSVLHTKGEVVDLESSVRGRTINLDTESNDARAEDLIRLAVRTDRPVLRGPVTFEAKIHIPEGNEDLSERLEVSAQFALTQGQFSNPAVQDKVDVLSRKGLGQPQNNEIAHVPSHLTASMHSRKGVIDFTSIRFDVPGAQLHLQGTYTLGNGDLAFNGDLFLDAKLSQTMTGAKSFFLKPIDPFFRGKNGGARIPVKVEGTKDHPVFGMGHEKAAKEPSQDAS